MHVYERSLFVSLFRMMLRENFTPKSIRDGKFSALIRENDSHKLLDSRRSWSTLM